MRDTLTTAYSASGEPGALHTVISGAGKGDSYHVDSSGALVRQPAGDPFCYVSHDASGAFRLEREVDGGRVESTIKFHNGIITSFSADSGLGQFGYRFAPTWVRQNCVGEPHEQLEPAVAELVEMILAVQAGDQVDLTTDSRRVMVALALCSPELLGPMNPADAWAMLDATQVKAIARWAR
ncbi:hypothetical protein [Pseudomonas mosselii]|uniref:hypothetical protein n=1 Tax=Pseudomonas mosselii TaxID=78327 RepID=UPI0021D9F880|nr:hypothetical protein [Pseudomonas mosselii]MCU9528490.1 hypothetical protein [Pseudomonas mosselii]MCU9535824.1 hypothetical protein [Pseudomonas mosselii]MCU9543863.1 hypothetical protein [Pseudomonas mosselii]MCU9550448.1 hypothetical protein [Pseudomonas mosselii]